MQDALQEVRDLAPTVAFLAAVLVLAELCDREGLFEATGHWMVGASRAGRWPWSPWCWWSARP